MSTDALQTVERAQLNQLYQSEIFGTQKPLLRNSLLKTTHIFHENMMRDRPLIQRSLCRRALRKQMGSASENQREMIRVALADQAIFETVYEQAMTSAAKDALASGEFVISLNEEGSPVVDNLLKLLNWFIENGPELVRMIELIVGLFGSATAAAVICEIEDR